ncbi:polysaccharide pyruvyl transferase family protein [Agromyces allii]|nr:polysaccharide pyruvyl transferase family protein [Agromyces allii]
MANDRSPIAVLIRTLPLRNGNIGGVLQAYALQTVLRELGASVVTDTSTKHRWTARWTLGAFRALITGAPVRASPKIRNEMNARLLAFVESRMATIDTTQSRSARKTSLQAEVAVVGSDQVWRPRYGDTARNMFADLDAVGWQGKRISYAASFGTESALEFSSDQKRKSSILLGEFSAVSVRETSAVRICADEFGVTAVQHADPVFLLSPSHYRHLAEKGTAEGGGIFAYVLDSTDSTRFILDTAASVRGVVAHGVLPLPYAGRKAFEQNPLLFSMPTVEDWLAGIARADLVITDSFHGTALSLVLNRPFWVLDNPLRGTTRISSLLSRFNLSHRSVSHAPSPGEDTRIDWVAVNQTIAAERETSLGFLRRFVGAADEP